MSTEAENIDPNRDIDQDDPRYNGVRYTELWVLTGIDPADDQEGIMPVSMLDAYGYRLEPGFAMATDRRRLRLLVRYGLMLQDQHPEYQLKIKHFKLAKELDLADVSEEGSLEAQVATDESQSS